MEDIAYEILKQLYTSINHKCTRKEIFDNYTNDTTEPRRVLNILRSHNPPLVVKSDGFYKIMPEGIKAYESEKEKREQNAKQEAEKRADRRKQKFDKRIAVITLIVAIIGILGTLFQILIPLF